MQNNHLLLKNWSVFFALAVASVCVFICLKYVNQPLLEAHAFRQTQTALTSFWMKEEGWQLAYQTPVVGYPWSIPFEFPIYQSIVALVSGVLGTPLDATGRVVSLVFLFLIAFPVRGIVKQLGLPSSATGIFCALLWSSPLYLFWGRSFMIETTALFLTVCTINHLLRLKTDCPQYPHAFLACLFGTLAIIQKVTTALPVLVVFGVFLLYHYLLQSSFRSLSKQQVLCLLLAFLVPVVCMQLWTQYTDSIKSQNEFGKTLTSAALSKWNFGSLGQRMSLFENFDIFWNRLFDKNIAGFLGIFLLAGGVIFGDQKARRMIAVCLVLFALPIYFFFNLHFIHDYYQTACLIYLIGALTVALAIWDKQHFRRPFFMMVCVVLLVGANFYHFAGSQFFGKLKHSYTAENEVLLQASKIINQATHENAAIVVFGIDWSSTIAYYSKRKAFTTPEWWRQENFDWPKMRLTIGGHKVEAVLSFLWDHMNVSRLLENPEVKARPQIYSFDKFILWLPGVNSITDPITGKIFYPLSNDSLNKFAYQKTL